MEMINKAAYADLKEAGMDNEKAVAIASHIPDWTQFTTRQDLLCMDTLPGVLTLVPTQGDIRQLRRYIPPRAPERDTPGARDYVVSMLGTGCHRDDSGQF